MQQSEAEQLWNKYSAGLCSPAEQELIEDYILYGAKDPDSLTANEMTVDLAALRERINAIPTKKKVIKPLFYYAVAASVLLCLVFTTYYFFIPQRVTTQFAIDVSPGDNKATLILANGNKINLNEAKKGAIQSLPGIKITKTADGQLVYEIDKSAQAEDQQGDNVIVTPKGGQHQIILPDGSKVWLNASSTLTFSTSLARDTKRIVILSGEAYFEIKKDKKHPFLVKGKDQTIRVLGTHFNVSDYPDDKSTKTTLLEGSVSLSSNNQPMEKATVLKPNQQAINNHHQIDVSTVDPDNVIAWKNGEFDFSNESLESILRKISRCYDVKIIYHDNEVKSKIFWGTASRYSNVSDVLNLLELTGQVKFQIKGKEITVMK